MHEEIAVLGKIKNQKNKGEKKTRNFRSCQFRFSDTRSRKIGLQKE